MSTIKVFIHDYCRLITDYRQNYRQILASENLTLFPLLVVPAVFIDQGTLRPTTSSYDAVRYD